MLGLIFLLRSFPKDQSFGFVKNSLCTITETETLFHFWNRWLNLVVHIIVKDSKLFNRNKKKIFSRWQQYNSTSKTTSRYNFMFFMHSKWQWLLLFFAKDYFYFHPFSTVILQLKTPWLKTKLTIGLILLLRSLLFLHRDQSESHWCPIVVSKFLILHISAENSTIISKTTLSAYAWLDPPFKTLASSPKRSKWKSLISYRRQHFVEHPIFVTRSASITCR